MKSSPPKARSDPVFVGDPLQSRASKTSATAEAGSKKGRFYKLLAKEFRRGGFQYRQIAREENAAIYEQAWPSCAEPSPSYEVIRVRCREGFQIGEQIRKCGRGLPKFGSLGRGRFHVRQQDQGLEQIFGDFAGRTSKERKGGKVTWSDHSDHMSVMPNIWRRRIYQTR
jgi:hypothetical protein